MKKKIKELINTDVKRKLFSNFMSLSVLQGINLVLPLITFPYLVRVLGVDKYGIIVFAQAFIGYFNLISDYGFNLSGTREISINKNSHKTLNKTFNAIFSAKLSLTFLGLLIMLLIVFAFNKFAIDWKLYVLTFGMVIGSSLFPIWFFQGVEKMKYITILTVIAKAIFTISILILVNSSKDYLLVPLLNSGGYIVSGLIALVIIKIKFKITFKLSSWNDVNQQLKNGWYIFISRISTNLYTVTTTFVLGLVTNNTVVGYYAIAEKVIRIVTSLFAPITQSIYPHIVQLVEKSSEQAIVFLTRILKFVLLFAGTIWVILFVFGAFIFQIVFGDNLGDTIFLFRIMSPLIIIIPIASILFNIALLSFNLDKYYLIIYLSGAILNIILLGLFLFALRMEAKGASISLLICETFITVVAAIILYKKNIRIFSIFNNIFAFATKR